MRKSYLCVGSRTSQKTALAKRTLLDEYYAYEGFTPVACILLIVEMTF